MTEPQTAAPPRTYIPVVTDLARLARVLVSPGAVFEEQREQQAFWVPLLIIAALITAGAVTAMPFQQRVIEVSVPAGTQLPGWVTILPVVIAPVFTLIMALVSGGLLYFAATTMGGEVNFRQAMTATVFSMAVGVLQLVAQLTVMRIRGLDSIHSARDAQVALGLDLLLPPDMQLGKFAEGVIAGIGPFELWSMALMAIGLTVLARMSKGKAWASAIACFVVLLLLRGGMAMLRRG